MQAIEYNPQRALTYEGETLPRLDWDGKKKTSEYAFIDTDDEKIDEILDGTFHEPELQKIIKNDDVYRVEKILRKTMHKGVVEYLVRWKGYKDPKFVLGFKTVIF